MQRKITIDLIKDEIKETHPNAKLISTKYVNSTVKLDLICEKEHNFNISWNGIQRGNWCGECSGNKTKTLDDVRVVLNKFHPEAKLLSIEYIDSKSKLEFICANGQDRKSVV